MAETRYIISDAAKMIDVEPHVLRYWEEELMIEIPRNEMGHRYYTDREIKLFTDIRDLKEKGFQLKAIKLILSTLNKDAPFGSADPEEKQMHADSGVLVATQTADSETDTVDNGQNETAVHEETEVSEVEKMAPEEKIKQFKYIMDAIFTESLQKNNPLLEEAVVDRVTDLVKAEVARADKQNEQRSEHYYQQLDAAIRGKQGLAAEAAAAVVPSYHVPKLPKKRRGLFGKKYKY